MKFTRYLFLFIKYENEERKSQMFVTDKDYGVACDQKWRQHFRALVQQERCRQHAEALKYNCHHTPRCFHIRYIIVNSVCIRAEISLTPIPPYPPPETPQETRDLQCPTWAYY